MSATEKVKGIIFSNLHDYRIPELTRLRTMASLPFCCRYRLIDFPLSNMVNSGITDVSVITSQNYQSLVDHVGAGKDWDLARRSGGLKIITPYMNAFAKGGNAPYTSRLEALKSIFYLLHEWSCDTVVLSDCDCICNISLSQMIARHEKSGADLTVAVKTMSLPRKESTEIMLFGEDGDGRVRDVLVHPAVEKGTYNVGLNLYVVSRRYLEGIVQDALTRGYTSLSRDILAKRCTRDHYRVYHYDGYYERMASLSEYFACNMRLLWDRDAKQSLFGIPKRPIYTKVHNSPPTKLSGESRVTNSLIADGCVIEGTVENSVLFRGVHVGKGAVVRNSILFQDTFVGEGVKLRCVITDKNVVILEKCSLSGHETMPFYIEKGKTV